MGPKANADVELDKELAKEIASALRAGQGQGQDEDEDPLRKVGEKLGAGVRLPEEATFEELPVLLEPWLWVLVLARPGITRGEVRLDNGLPGPLTACLRGSLLAHFVSPFPEDVPVVTAIEELVGSWQTVAALYFSSPTALGPAALARDLSPLMGRMTRVVRGLISQRLGKTVDERAAREYERGILLLADDYPPSSAGIIGRLSVRGEDRKRDRERNGDQRRKGGGRKHPE